MVYLLANSPSSAASTQLYQTDIRTVLSDPSSQWNAKEVAEERAKIDRVKAGIDISKWTVDVRNDPVFLESFANKYGVDTGTVRIAFEQAEREQDSRQQSSASTSGWGTKLDFASPAHAAQWGQQAMATLKDYIKSYNRDLQLYGERDQMDAWVTANAQVVNKAKGMSEDESKAATAKLLGEYEKGRVRGLQQDRAAVNFQIMLLSDQFNVDGPLVKVNDDGTLALSDAVVSWGGRGGSLTLLAGAAKAPADASGHVEPLDGQVRQQTDLWSHGLGPARPADVPPAGGFVDVRA